MVHPYAIETHEKLLQRFKYFQNYNYGLYFQYNVISIL